jgi:hypothetical protein
MVMGAEARDDEASVDWADQTPGKTMMLRRGGGRGRDDASIETESKYNPDTGLS